MTSGVDVNDVHGAESLCIEVEGPSQVFVRQRQCLG